MYNLNAEVVGEGVTICVCGLRGGRCDEEEDKGQEISAERSHLRIVRVYVSPYVFV